jgi:predicted Zn-dependent peptidase
MLNQALRVESGLTYGVFSVLTRPSLPGSIAVSSFTPAESTVEAIDMALGVLDKLHAAEIGEDQLTSARNYVLGQFPAGLETARQVAAMLARIEFYGLGRDYVDAYGDALGGVDVAALAATIEEVYPRPDELVLVLLGDADRIREDVVKYGEVTEMPITEPNFRP